MKTKNLIILAAIVIAVLAYIMLFERHRPTSDESAAAAEKVLLDFERDNVVGIGAAGDHRHAEDGRRQRACHSCRGRAAAGVEEGAAGRW
ncbi:MAG: hypothetical protein IFK92_07625 [Acidobacteria bacterium]|nr:hypothetical protein [Candidatus Sulfomarinibacter kjeldsenii]